MRILRGGFLEQGAVGGEFVEELEGGFAFEGFEAFALAWAIAGCGF